MLTITPHLNVLMRLLGLGIFGLLLASCESPQVKPDKGAYTTAKSGIQQADQLLNEAAQLESPQRDAKLLAAAQLYSTANRPAKAEEAIRQIRPEALELPQLAQYSLLYADLAISDERYLLAKQVLGNARLQRNLNSLTATQRLQWHKLNAELHELTGDSSKSLYEYTRVVALLDNPEDIGDIHNKIWKLLSRFSDQDLETSANLSVDDSMVGWFQLAQVIRQSQGDIARQVEAIRQWQASHSNHPATRILPSSLQQAMILDKNLPRRLALLLPGNAEYQLATQTVRDGLLAAYYEVLGSGGSVPDIRLYDTDSSDIVALYQQAVNDGADLVIGPLRKEKLATLLAQPSLPVPVLGLNYVEDATNSHDNLYQFGLSIRDEAEQIAERAWVAGYRSVLAITPKTGWGDGALKAFEKSWLNKGGKIVATTSYDNNTNDYSPLLEPAFLVSHSRARAQKLKQALGKNIAYTPTRRRDLDMIFLIAYPQNGRQIKPTLDFLYAADLPVFATSHIYDGTVNTGQNRDLDGISFTAMPWTVKAFAAGNIRPQSDLPGNYRSLFALGVDAYRLHQWLPLLKAFPEAETHGYTGSLSLGTDNQVIRKQPWAYFKNGMAVPAPILAGEVARE